MHGLLRGGAEFFDRRCQGVGFQFETNGYRAHRRHDLGLPYKYDGPSAVRRNGRHSPDGADFTIGKYFLAIDLRRVHGCLSAVVGGTHRCIPLKIDSRRYNGSSFRRCHGGLLRYWAWHTQAQHRSFPFGALCWESPCWCSWRSGCITCSASTIGATSWSASKPSPTRNCCVRLSLLAQATAV